MPQPSLTSKLGRSSGRLAALGGEFKRAFGLISNPRVPLYLKLLLPVGALAYWFWPLDLIPGLPIDDVAVLLIALRVFLSLADRALGNRGDADMGDAANSASYASESFGAVGNSAAGSNVVDGTWEKVDE